MSDVAVIIRDGSAAVAGTSSGPTAVIGGGAGSPGEKGDPGSPGEGWSSRAALKAAAAAATNLDDFYLSEAGREGKFIFRSGDYSAQVAADTAEGLYLAADGIAATAGALVREFKGPVDPEWFGVTRGDASGANASANSTAFSAMLGVLRARAQSSSTGRGSEPIRFPSDDTYELETVELLDAAFEIEGCGPAGRTYGTRLKFAAGQHGIMVQRHNTEGLTGSRASAQGADRSIFRSLRIVGGYSGTDGEFHGIVLRARAYIENCYIQDFEGDGIYGHATAGGSPDGNANNSIITGGRIEGCRNGVFIDGADANIWTLVAVDCSSNRRWGFLDSSFLGNTYLGCHASANGLVSGTTPSVVHYSGNRYTVVYGQESGASTNAPSGTTADNTWWIFQGAGGTSPSNNINDWSSGTTYTSGGSFLTDNSNARNWLGGCYHESGQGKAQLTAPTFVSGGMLASNVSGTAVAPTVSTAGLWNIPNLRAVSNASAASGGIGYGTGAGGTVTQVTNKTTSVTLHAFSGTITTHNANLNAGATANFVFTNNRIAAGDCVVVNLASGGTAGAYDISVYQVSAGQARISVVNRSAGALAEALVINFAVIKGATS